MIELRDHERKKIKLYYTHMETFNLAKYWFFFLTKFNKNFGKNTKHKSVGKF